MTKLSSISTIDATDRDLIALLRADARQPTAVLARKLGLARSTVQSRMASLEGRGIIAGYTVRLDEEVTRRRIAAHVMISVNPKLADRVVHTLRSMTDVTSLYAVSGRYDLVAVVRSETTEDIDALLDSIGRIPGIERTTSSILLSKKFERD